MTCSFWLLERDDQLAQLGVGEGLDRGLRGGGGLLGRLVGRERVDEAARQVLEREAAGGLGDAGLVGGGQVFLQAGEAGGHRGEHVGLGVAERDGLQQLLQRHGLLLVHAGGSRSCPARTRPRSPR